MVNTPQPLGFRFRFFVTPCRFKVFSAVRAGHRVPKTEKIFVEGLVIHVPVGGIRFT
jgi:hypothetical protein